MMMMDDECSFSFISFILSFNHTSHRRLQGAQNQETQSLLAYLCFCGERSKFILTWDIRRNNEGYHS